MRIDKLALPFSFVAAVAVPLSCFGQAAGTRERATSDGDAQFFVAQRLWVATWDYLLADSQLVIPDPANATPVVRTSLVSTTSNAKVIPITTLGFVRGPVTVSASVYPRTKFVDDDSKIAGGDLARSEFDISAGYQLLPNVSASLIYKAGRVSQAVTTATSTFSGTGQRLKLRALLVGLGASAALTDNLSLYGNAALGPGKIDSEPASPNFPDSDQKFVYKIGEVGLSYRLPVSFGWLSNLSLQAGYRSQVISIRDAAVQTFSTTGTLISSENRRVSSTTDGIAIGLVASF